MEEVVGQRRKHASEIRSVESNGNGELAARLYDVRQRLMELRDRGYAFVETSDDGDTWVGSRTKGLVINDLIEHGFLGDVKTQPKLSDEVRPT
jgi:hypothetical protein